MGTPAADEPLPSGSLTVNLSAVVQQLWAEVDKYIDAGMKAKAARELGPQEERQNLDRIKKGFDALMRSGRVPAAELEQMKRLMAKCEKEVTGRAK